MPLAIRYRGKANLKPVDNWFKDFGIKFDKFQAELADCIIKECQDHLELRYKNSTRQNKRESIQFLGGMGESFENKSNWKVKVFKNGNIHINYIHKDSDSSVDKLHIIDHGTRPIINGDTEDVNYSSPVTAGTGIGSETRSQGDRRTWLQSFQFQEDLSPSLDFVDAGTRRYQSEPLTGSYARSNKKDQRGEKPKQFRKTRKLDPHSLKFGETTNFSESIDMDNSLMDRPMGEFRRNIKAWADQKFGWDEGDSGYWPRMLGLWNKLATEGVDNEPEPKLMSGGNTGLFLDNSPPYKTPSPILKQIIKRCIKDVLGKGTGKSKLSGMERLPWKGVKGKTLRKAPALLIQQGEVITYPSRRIHAAVLRNRQGHIVKWLSYTHY
tara:strand:+ start:347 stop:1489 length:1143 start_codon:yes stop_codon:yes gene_type:complete